MAGQLKRNDTTRRWQIIEERRKKKHIREKKKEKKKIIDNCYKIKTWLIKTMGSELISWYSMVLNTNNSPPNKLDMVNLSSGTAQTVKLNS